MRSRSLLVSTLALLFAATTAAQAASMAELKKRFKERYPKLLKAKTEGKAGETFKGYVEAVKEEYLKDEALKKLLDDENADRKTLYGAIAKKENTTPEKVAERNAVRKFKRAKKGEYLKNKDGKWEQKKDEG